MRHLLDRIVWKYRRTLSEHFYRKIVPVALSEPMISFSFDDAPQTAFNCGRAILEAQGVKATFFVSLGLLGSASPSGPIASQRDLIDAVEKGHELGCHTFDHKDPWKTDTRAFEQSVIKNRQALSEILPEYVFKSFAYPLCGPKPTTKLRMGEIFSCCRGGGQTSNFCTVDVNFLKAFFLDFRNGHDLMTVRRLIDQNRNLKGWLIFATHDVIERPSPYGCTPFFFEKVVQYAARSGALLLPVAEALDRLCRQYLGSEK